MSSPLGQVVEHREDSLGTDVSEVRGAALSGVSLLCLVDHLHHLIVYLQPDQKYQGVFTLDAALPGVLPSLLD